MNTNKSAHLEDIYSANPEVSLSKTVGAQRTANG